MAYLTNCTICGFGIMNAELCPDCMRIVSSKALRGERINKKAIKKEVLEQRLKPREVRF